MRNEFVKPAAAYAQPLGGKLFHTCIHTFPCVCLMKNGVIMATNLAIDDKLIEDARRIGKHRTKKAVVTEALVEYIQRREQLKILGLFGSIEYDNEYDYKEQRKRN
jgi:hypothetical protein